MPAKKKGHPTINLLPQDEFENSLLGRILRWILTSFRVIVIVVELVVIIGFVSRFYFDTKNADLDDSTKEKASIVASYATFEQEFRGVQKKLESFSDFTKEGDQVEPVINYVKDRLPVDINLTLISREGNTVKIQGQSAAESSILQFIANAKAGSMFDDVVVTQISNEEDTPLLDFTLSADLNTQQAQANPNGI